MPYVFNHPILIFVVSLSVFWLSSAIGTWLSKHSRASEGDEAEYFKFVLGSVLTLLALIVGFTFSMAVNRYDHRKNLEEEEANAIGTEYVRADLLPASDSTKVRALLKNYLSQRILAYRSRDEQRLQEISAETARLQTEMWSAVAGSGGDTLSPLKALAVAGMNDVLNSQGYTQAAWLDRIPVAAWTLLFVISIFSNLLIGYSMRTKSVLNAIVLPVALSVSFFLIADIDSPRHGVIRVHPQNLEVLSQSLTSQ